MLRNVAAPLGLPPLKPRKETPLDILNRIAVTLGMPVIEESEQ